MSDDDPVTTVPSTPPVPGKGYDAEHPDPGHEDTDGETDNPEDLRDD